MQTIRRWYRNRPANVICPLTQEKLTRPIFRYITETGHVHGYCLVSLIRWIEVQGKAIDPVTRMVYNAIELKRMDREAKIHGLICPSVYQLCTDPIHQARYETERETSELILIVTGEGVEEEEEEEDEDGEYSDGDEHHTGRMVDEMIAIIERLKDLYSVNRSELEHVVMDYLENLSRLMVRLAHRGNVDAVIHNLGELKSLTDSSRRAVRPGSVRESIRTFINGTYSGIVEMRAGGGVPAVDPVGSGPASRTRRRRREQEEEEQRDVRRRL